MNKTAIKNFAIWARRKLISDITYKAGLLGINEKGIADPLSISTENIQFFDVGTGKPTEIANEEVKQRKALIKRIKEKETTSDYITAYQYVVEEVAYTWFNRLIAIRFMEVNDYLPSRIRVLSSDIQGKLEPDIVTTPFDTDLEFSAYEQDKIIQLKDENKLDELFRMLFIKQSNKLNEVLPGLFEKTSDYTELLLNISFTVQEGIVNHLIKDIEEEDFTEAVEIIGWLYQYYNEERKNEVINIYKGTVKKEDIPAATQLFTTDWVVRYMVDNSLGRYWIEHNPQSKLHEKLEYFVSPKKGEVVYLNEKVLPGEITFFDPCMGSGHILVYAFDVLIEIYRECGFLDRDAAREIVENNIFGLDIDNRAYQLAYFAVMMKARSYDRRFLMRQITPKVHPIYDYTELTNTDNEDLNYLISEFRNAKQYGSLVHLRRNLNVESIQEYIDDIRGQISFESLNIEKITNVITIAKLMMDEYSIVCTNPPYLKKMNNDLKNYVKDHYKDYSGDLFSAFMYKNFDYCKPDGYSAFMTPFVWMFIKSYSKLREYIINEKSISSLIQMEYSAFEEATVPICTFVLKNGRDNLNGTYIKLSDFKGGMQIQRQKVLEAIQIDECSYLYEKDCREFLKIPESPIAYWVSDSMIGVFEKSKMLSDFAKPRQGLATSDNNRFLKMWYELSFKKIGFNITCIDDQSKYDYKWFPCTKGGSFRRWYGNNEYVINWENDGKEIKDFAASKYKNYTRTIKNIPFYFQSGLSWSTISSGLFSLRYVPQGSIFETKGAMCFVEDKYLKYILGLYNSSVMQKFLGVVSPTLDYHEGPLSKTPIVIEMSERIDELVADNINLTKKDWDSDEISWDFKKHPLAYGKSVELAYDNFENEINLKTDRLKANEEELNNIYRDIYDLHDEVGSEVDDKYISLRKFSRKSIVTSFISYAVGCMFGRYSLDIEGLVLAGDKLDTSKYESFSPDLDNCIPITDEEYFTDDIVGRFVNFVEIVYGKGLLEENLEFIANSIGGKGNTAKSIIRNYFIKDFYNDHIKRYQKRPIYWLYDSGKQNGFKALIYVHRYDSNTTGIVRVDYLHKIQKVYTSEISSMQDMIENGVHSNEIVQAEKRKEKLIKQLKEAKEYDEKVAHIALSRISIDLDDGVKVNYEKVQTGQDGKKLQILAKI